MVGQPNQYRWTSVLDDEFDESSIGVDKEPPTKERGDKLTLEDIDWAMEQGAKSEDEIFRMVKEHKEQTEWHQ